MRAIPGALDPFGPPTAKVAALLGLVSTVAERVLPQLARLDGLAPSARATALRNALPPLVGKVAAEGQVPVGAEEQLAVVDAVIDELLGLGPIEALLRDDQVDEVMVNGPRQVYAERKGKLVLTSRVFRDDGHVLDVIQRIVKPLGRHIDATRPICDCRLADGSRVNAIIAPSSIDGPTLTIRKFKKDRLGIDDLVRFGTLSQEMADFLGACVRGRLNIVVSGGTGSGKTTTLNVLSNFIPDDERIITVEDAAELQIRKQHVVRLETRPPDLEGKHEITIRDLVRNCLRMRPERIIVGEIRGGEAFDMLQAMNTGHDGSLTTGHANTPRDMIRRLETMTMMAGFEIPLLAIREQIASAVQLIVQQNRMQDGSRRITHITEIQGMEGAVVTLSDIFLLKGGVLQPTGLRPRFESRLKDHGTTLPPGMFAPRRV